MKTNLLKKYRKIAKEKVYLSPGIREEICIVYCENTKKNRKEYYYEKQYNRFSQTYCEDNDSFTSINDECLKCLNDARRIYILKLLRKKREKSKGALLREKRNIENYRNKEKYLKTF